MSDEVEEMEEMVSQLRKVATGLRFIMISLGVMVVNSLAGIGVMIAFLELKGNPVAMLHALYRDHANIMMILTALGVLSRLLAIIGKFFCVSVPLKSAATPLIVMSLSASAIGLVLGLAGQMPDFSDYADDLQGSGLVLSVVGYLFFLRFLTQLATFLGSAHMRIRSRRVLIGSASVLGLIFLAGLGGSAGAGGALTVVVGLMAGIGALGVFAMYAMLIHDMRNLAEGAACYVEEREGLVES